MSTFANALKAFPVLTTKRLTLRALSPEDAAAYFKQISALPTTSSWSGGYSSRDIAGARMAINSVNNRYKRSKTIIPWGITMTRGGKLIGQMKLFDIENRTRGEIGYWIGQDHRSKGFATEAVLATVDFAFDRLAMHRLFAVTDPDNPASQHVLEKSGFVREGVLRQHTARGGQWRDSIIYGLLSSDRQSVVTSQKAG